MRIADWALDPLTEGRLLNTKPCSIGGDKKDHVLRLFKFPAKPARMLVVALQARRAFLFMSCVVSKRISMPGFIKPQLATLKSKAPKGEHWL
jgi:hypothetical protein